MNEVIPKEDVYRIELCTKAWRVTDVSTSKSVIENVTYGTAQQYVRILNEAYDKGYEKGYVDGIQDINE